MPTVPASASVVGFFLHLTGKTGCGDVAFWATRHPVGPSDVVTPADVRLNHGRVQEQRTLDIYGKQEQWVECHRCGKWYHINLKHYRSIPHPADIGRKAAAADQPVRGIDLRDHAGV